MSLNTLYIILWAILGAVLGSFLNVVIDRVPAHESLVEPASHCPGCQRRLTALDMIPIISYVALRGRCRTCGARIPGRVLLVEVLTAGALAAVMWRYGLSLRMGLTSIYTLVLIAIYFIDMEHQLILDVISLPATGLALLAVPLQLVMQPPAFGLYAMPWILWGLNSASPTLAQWAMISQGLGLLSSVALFGLIYWLARRSGGMGFGDVKLAAFTGVITGFPGGIVAAMGSFILGGVAAIYLLSTGKANRKTAIPFGPFLVIATFVYLLFGDAIINWYIWR